MWHEVQIKVFVSVLYTSIVLFQHHLPKRIFSPPLNCLYNFVVNQLFISVGVSFQVLHFCFVSCLAVFMSVTHCLDCCSCVIGLRHLKHYTVPALFLFQNYFDCSGSFAFSSKFQNQFNNIYLPKSGIFIRTTLNQQIHLWRIDI